MKHMLHSAAVVCLVAAGCCIVSRRLLDERIPVAAWAALVAGAIVCPAPASQTRGAATER